MNSENGRRQEGVLPGVGERLSHAARHSERLHVSWLAFIRYCSHLQHGEIERLKIQDGLPILAEACLTALATIGVALATLTHSHASASNLPGIINRWSGGGNVSDSVGLNNGTLQVSSRGSRPSVITTPHLPVAFPPRGDDNEKWIHP